MKIYYMMIEAVPNKSNPESKEFGGAFVNVWVKAETVLTAINKAKKYISEEKWKFIRIKEISPTERSVYIDIPESLECYDEACEHGMSAIFYTWSIDDKDETDLPQ